MKHIIYIILFLTVPITVFGASGAPVTYSIEGKPYDGYFVSPNDQAPFVMLIHDWDGLTEHEVQRANMLADLGYS